MIITMLKVQHIYCDKASYLASQEYINANIITLSIYVCKFVCVHACVPSSVCVISKCSSRSLHAY